MSTYDRQPTVRIRGHESAAWRGWHACADAIAAAARGRRTIVVETYPGVDVSELRAALAPALTPTLVIDATEAVLPPERLGALVDRDLSDDRVFGFLTPRRLEDLCDPDALARLRAACATGDGRVLVVGTGASLVHAGDLLVYADLPRWEIQLRQRVGRAGGIGTAPGALAPAAAYKRGFFLDWRVADRRKRELWPRVDLVLDTTVPGDPRLATGAGVRDALARTARRPFRLVPYFDPAPWGGTWMRDVCGLDPAVANYGWSFDGVPEENSLRLDLGPATLELPALDLVFQEPRALLGEAVHARFGAEFPIRFDLLDTMGGGNLSLQVHPLTEYIQDRFGMHYTQDESYYLLDASPDACVYLGLRDDCDPAAMARELRAAQAGGPPFAAERHAQRWPAHRHDHFLIPAGTVHCSGAGSMVLEISATPYIFTFKLWDWGRTGLDGRPRPIHLDHGLANIQWDRRTAWTHANLVDRTAPLAVGDGWRSERTGLHEREFIDTVRHWFAVPTARDTRGGVHMLNLVEGAEAVIESPAGAFEPFAVHYAETVVIPAACGAYTMRPYGSAVGTICATITASVR